VQSISKDKSFTSTEPSLSVRNFLDGWRVSAFLISFLVVVPVAVVLAAVFSSTGHIWEHLVGNVLFELLVNTLWLVSGVAAGTLILGVSLAWLTSVCEFPGRKFFSWALFLPLSMPAYVMAFVFIGLFDFTGPVQTQLREWFGTSSVPFPDVRSRGGVIIVMTLVLYPYVYLLSRNAFLTQGKRALEATQTLGHGTVSGFFYMALPMARPWITAGVILVVMEALADFGAVSIFNYNTFTTAIYKAWFGFFSLPAASQLSSILVLLVFVIIAVEQYTRSRMRFTRAGRESAAAARVLLTGMKKWAAFAYALSVLLAAFVIPFTQILLWTIDVFQEEFTARYVGFLGHSVLLGLAGAVSVCLTALVLSYAARHHPDMLSGFLTKTATIGYALPGTVLAVGVFIPVAFLDNLLISAFKSATGIEVTRVLKGTVSVLIAAYLIRFMAAGFNSIDSAMHRITRSIDEASILMGIKGLTMLFRVHLPILKGGVVAAAILVFVDIMKEMPITLMMRPFGWDTLAVKIFELTSEGEWERAALPALTLVLAGIIPVILLTRHGEKS
jgi:iron(III) transport system permease protein